MTILSKIPPNDCKLTCQLSSFARGFPYHLAKLRSAYPPTDVWQDKLIHYVSSEGIVYLVVADDTVGRRTPFAFLAEVERRVSL